MGKTIMSKIKWLLALCAVTVLALVGGIFSLNTKAEAKAEPGGSVLPEAWCVPMCLDIVALRGN